MSDRERLRALVAEGDVTAARALLREQHRNSIAEDDVLLRNSRWFRLLIEAQTNFESWRAFAELVLEYPDADDYRNLNNFSQNHLRNRTDADIMDVALAKIRQKIYHREPFSIRGRGRRR